MAKIYLTNGGFATVDSKHYRTLNEFKWTGKKEKGGTHAVRYVTIGDKKVTIRMHRVIAEARFDERVEHINGDTLDNRMKNLQSKVLRPYVSRPHNCGYVGVNQCTAFHWNAHIKFSGKEYIIGDKYRSSVDAARAYDTVAKKLFGESAVTNF